MPASRIMRGKNDGLWKLCRLRYSTFTVHSTFVIRHSFPSRYDYFVRGKSNNWLTGALPYAFMLLAALSRWPGLFPPNFSAFYGLAFCAGAFFPGTMKWWLPFVTLI